jgi:hypothetical protein
MKKSLYLSLIFVLLSSCSTVKNGSQPVLGQDKLPVESSQTQHDVDPTESKVTPTPTPLVNVGVTFVPVEYYTTKAQREKIKKAEKKMNEVIQSQCFKDFMSKRAMIDTNGKKSYEVVEHLQSLSGKIPVEMYNPGRFSSAVAYRSPPSLTIHLSYNYFTTDMDDCEWASTMAHESLGHSLGEYDHDYRWSASREYSVPYSINHAFSKESFSGSPSGGCCKGF